MATSQSLEIFSVPKFRDLNWLWLASLPTNLQSTVSTSWFKRGLLVSWQRSTLVAKKNMKKNMNEPMPDRETQIKLKEKKRKGKGKKRKNITSFNSSFLVLSLSSCFLILCSIPIPCLTNVFCNGHWSLCFILFCFSVSLLRFLLKHAVPSFFPLFCSISQLKLWTRKGARSLGLENRWTQ